MADNRNRATVNAVCVAREFSDKASKRRYWLRTDTGTDLLLTSEQIKHKMRNNLLSVSNMKITTNNRLIVTK